jgi:preprotein translocase subunit SecE
VARTREKTGAEEETRAREKTDTRRDRSADSKRRPSGKRAGQRKGTKSRNPVIRYFQETGEELRKVTWPTRQQTIRLTLIVLGAMVAFIVFLGLLDMLFQQLASLLV